MMCQNLELQVRWEVKRMPPPAKAANNSATDEYLGAGNFKYFCVFSPLVEEDLQVEEHIFSNGLKETTNY